MSAVSALYASCSQLLQPGSTGAVVLRFAFAHCSLPLQVPAMRTVTDPLVSWLGRNVGGWQANVTMSFLRLGGEVFRAFSTAPGHAQEKQIERPSEPA